MYSSVIGWKYDRMGYKNRYTAFMGLVKFLKENRETSVW